LKGHSVLGEICVRFALIPLEVDAHAPTMGD
jgi:hypothetical protein